MTHRIDTLIQRATALAFAAVITLTTLGGIDALATRDVNANALLAAHGTAEQMV